MNKTYGMIQAKKKSVIERHDRVEDICKSLVESTEKITYNRVSEIAHIPVKTLERNPYKDTIIKYRSMLEKEEYNPNVRNLKEKINHLNLIIEQLRKENKGLITELYRVEKL